MATVTEFYIVPKSVYEKCNEPVESLQDKIKTLPKKAKSSSSALLDHLKPLLQLDNETGQVNGLSENVFAYINYSVRGKKRPSDWDTFLPNLLTVPSSILCEKVKREVKLLKRRNGRKVHSPRVD